MFVDMINSRKELVTIQEASEITKVARRTIYNWMAEDKIDYTRTAGGCIRIIRDSLFKLNNNRKFISSSNKVNNG